MCALNPEQAETGLNKYSLVMGVNKFPTAGFYGTGSDLLKTIRMSSMQPFSDRKQSSLTRRTFSGPWVVCKQTMAACLEAEGIVSDSVTATLGILPVLCSKNNPLLRRWSSWFRFRLRCIHRSTRMSRHPFRNPPWFAARLVCSGFDVTLSLETTELTQSLFRWS